MKSRLRLFLTCALLFLFGFGQPAGILAAQTAGDTLSETNLTESAIGSYLTNLITSTEVEASLKPVLTNIYQAALQRVRERDLFKSMRLEHEKAILESTNQVTALRNEVGTTPSVSTNDLGKPGTVELTALLSQAQANEEVAKKARDKLLEDATRRKARGGEIPKQISTAKAKLDEIKLGLNAKSTEGEAAEISRANRLLLLTRKSLREEEIDTLETELKAYDTTAGLLSLQTEREAGRLVAFTKAVAILREKSAAAGKREAELAAARAAQDEQRMRETFWKSFGELSQIASNNTVLADRLKDLNSRTTRAAAELSAREIALDKLDADVKTVKGRVEAFEVAEVRLNQKVGELLRDHRRNLLKDVSRSIVRKRLGEITDTYLRELEDRENLQKYVDIEGQVTELVQTFVNEGSLDANDTNRIAEVAVRSGELLRAGRDHHNRLVEANKALGQILTRLNLTDIEFGRKTKQFQSYIEERVLWVRSSQVISGTAVVEELTALGNLLNPVKLASLPAILWDGLISEPSSAGFWLLLTLLVILGQPGARRRLSASCDRARQRDNISLWPTWTAVLITAVVSAPVPVAFWATGEILGMSTAGTTFSNALANALTFSGTIYFTLGFFRQLTRRPGLAADHFNWTEKDTSRIRRHLNWFLGTAAALVFVIAFVESDRAGSTQARLSFLILVGAMTVFNFLLLHPIKGLSSPTVRSGQETWRRVRFVVSIVIPVLLGLASVVGYHFTAIELSWRLVDSMWLVLGIVLLSKVMLRWFYLERKRVTLEKLDLRKAATSDTTILTVDQAVANINISEIKEQTQSLLRIVVLVSLLTGLWAIWSDATPALNILDRKALWHVEVAPRISEKTESALAPAIPTAAITGISPSAATPPSSENAPPKKVLMPITVADVLFAVAVIGIMLIVARNLPSFLELLILKHLKLETGGAYAITTIVQYVVIVFGIIVACSSIGLSWEKVQWLAAAVTLGIGFGLQEIFANFVAGIILLFERPVRVGDIITVDGTSGTVSRIRIRATTVTNWERQELIIPNKDLITGRLTNWTLSDTTNRLLLTVGIAYGSDTRMAREILLDVLAKNEFVMEDPVPKVTFDLFGDSSLNFTIRAFLSNMDNRLEAIHTLHQQIDDRFKEAGIEISFPQRDLHIRSGLEGLTGAGQKTVQP